LIISNLNLFKKLNQKYYHTLNWQLVNPEKLI